MSTATSAPGTAPRLVHVAWDDPDAAVLRAAQQAELRERYGEDDIGHAMGADTVVVMVLLRDGDHTLACGALRDATADLGAGVAEIKRMYVRPSARGRGLSRTVLAELERIAAERGITRLVLETGILQPEAIGLYLSAGFLPVDNYAEYAGVVDSRCFGKDVTPAPVVRGVPGPAPVVALVAADDPDAVALRRALLAEVAADDPADALAGADAATLDAAAGTTDLGATFVARVDGRAVGCVGVRRADAPWPREWAEVRRLYVAPDARRTGVASHLLQAAEDAARADGATHLLVDTRVRLAPAVALVTRAGYRPVRPAGDWAAHPTTLWFARAL